MSIPLGSWNIGLPLGMPLTNGVILGLILLASWFVSNYQLFRWLGNERIGKLSLLLSLNTLAFVSLLGLILEVKVASVGIQSVTLVTRGATQAQLANLAQETPDATLYSLQATGLPLPGLTNKSAKPTSLGKNITHLDFVERLAQLHPNLQQINLIGDGLTPVQWQQLYASTPNWGSPEASKLGITFTPSAKLSGPINLSWQKQLVLGEPMTIKGELQTTQSAEGKTKRYRLILIDPAGDKIAQQRLGPEQKFSFRATPKTSGPWLYQLKLFVDGGKSPVATESIAVDVSSAPPQSIAMWQSAPSFETLQLKRWAANSGTRLTVISQISQTKFISERLNPVRQTDLKNQLTPEAFFQQRNLENYDLLLIDGRGLVSLDKYQRAQLAQAVSQGLGLLILADTDLLSAKDSILNNLSPGINLTSNSKNMTYAPSAAHGLNISSSTPISWLWADLTIDGGEVLIKGDTEQALVVKTPKGLGQVSVSLVKTSYSWQTQGQDQLYSQYWQNLIQHLARNRSTSYWQTEPADQLGYYGQLHKICATSTPPQTSSSHPSRLAASMSSVELNIPTLPLILQSSVVNDSSHCAHYWATKPSWQQFTLFAITEETSIKSDQQLRYFYPVLAWQAWQQANKHQSSARVEKFATKAQPKLHYRAIDKWFFYLGLVISLSLLWLARKHH